MAQMNDGMGLENLLSLLFSPTPNPQAQLQLAQQLAATNPPPALPQGPNMGMVLNPQQPQVMPPQMPNAPMLPGMGGLMPGEVGGIPTQMPAPVEDRSRPMQGQQRTAGLTPEQLKALSAYGNPGGLHPAVAPPGQRALMPMVQIPNPQAFGPMPTLAALLEGRR